MNDEFTELIGRAAALGDRIERAFGALSAGQLNWKTGEASWSVGQCLEHLMITNDLEFPALENALRADYKDPFWSRLPFLPAFFGRAMIYVFGPKNLRRIRAPKSFRPTQSRIDGNIVEAFAAHQRKLTGLLEKSRHLNPRKTKVVSPVSGFITYSLYDAYKILIVHEERHFQQAVRVAEERGFPK